MYWQLLGLRSLSRVIYTVFGFLIHRMLNFQEVHSWQCPSNLKTICEFQTYSDWKQHWKSLSRLLHWYQLLPYPHRGSRLISRWDFVQTTQLTTLELYEVRICKLWWKVSSPRKYFGFCKRRLKWILLLELRLKKVLSQRIEPFVKILSWPSLLLAKLTSSWKH